MSHFTKRLLFATLMTFAATFSTLKAETREADIIIYGGTSSGVVAAVQARAMGKSVILVGPDRHLGGLSAGGLGWTDSGNTRAIGGLSREFYHRVWQQYNDPDHKQPFNEKQTTWKFEPHIAEAVYDAWIKKEKIPVYRGQWLDRDKGVVVSDGKIVSMTMLDGTTYKGKMFIDATYEGDLMAAAGVSYHVGRESSKQYGEKYNGVQAGTWTGGHHFRKLKVDPYVAPGDPKSGVLPRISTKPPGKTGAADHRIQAYCFRMCLTQVPENRIPFTKPKGYDPGQYEVILRVYKAGWPARNTFNKFDRIPGGKTDTNNHGPFSTDNIGMNYDYPEASYERRREIIAEHELYQRGLMYFLANDPRMPEEVRTKMSTWGLAKDEFTDNGNWPHQIYVREARRMVGEYVMTENEIMSRRPVPAPVGMGSYTMDSHHVQRYIRSDGTVENEGDIQVRVPRPYSIAYGSITPKKTECRNLIVPVAISSSHIAYGSIRMEPVFMLLGQSAATAASHAIDENSAVQEIDYDKLRTRLEKDRQRLSLK